jgi:hypothetical protein
MPEAVVWWLTPSEIQDMKDWALPEVLLRLVASATGRSGRGRLWNVRTDGRFDDFRVTFNETTPLARHCVNCVGLVIAREEVALLADLPGVVTDQNLKRFPV